MKNDDCAEYVTGGGNDPIQANMTDGCKENVVVEQLNWKFLSRAELVDLLREFYMMQGYGISIANSRKDKHVTIKCDMGVVIATIGIGKKLVDGTWIVEVKNSPHNHEPSSDMSGHRSCRRLSREEMLSIEEMTKSGTPPCQIISSLRQRNPKLQVVSRSIYNAKAKLQRDNLAGRAMIQALLEEINQGDFIFNVVHNHVGQITHLFFAHPSSIKLTKSYSNVFVMDCTYKTNKHKMPLFNIVGVSSFNTSFYSCFAFLEKEEEQDYTWALEMFSKMLGSNFHPSVIVSDRELALMNAMKVIFPTTKNILCVWHIEKNILSHCKSAFDQEDGWNAFLSLWNEVLASSDEETYEETWKHFEVLYKDKEKVLCYIKNTWIPFKGRFVRAWTDKFVHFGNRASSRAEGAHAKLKRFLQVSTGDIHQVKNIICLSIENEFKEFKTRLASEKIRVPHKGNIPFFKEIVTNVSMFMMGELIKQYECMKNGTLQARCTKNFKTSMGLPCAHMMMIQEGMVLHPQWRIDIKPSTSFEKEQTGDDDNFKSLLCELEVGYAEWPEVQKEQAREKVSQLISPSILVLFEPNVEIHKGRPSSSKKRMGTTSTKRNSSQFEIAQATRKCSFCNGIGHNIRTCTLKLDSNEGRSGQLTGDVDVFDLNMMPTESDSLLFDW